MVTLGFAMFNAASDFYKVFAMTVESASVQWSKLEDSVSTTLASLKR